MLVEWDMNKKVYLSISLLVLSSFVLSACGKEQANTSGGSGSNKSNDVSDMFKGSVKDLLGVGKKVRCDWKVEEGEMKMSGVVWVDGERSRTEMAVSTPEGEMVTNFLSDGEYTYSWGAGDQGWKFKVSDFEGEVEDSEVEEGNAQFKDWNKEYEYDCKKWVVEGDKFKLPDGIEFVDMGEQVKQMQEQAEDMQKNMKGLCDSLPEPQKTECLKGFE